MIPGGELRRRDLTGSLATPGQVVLLLWEVTDFGGRADKIKGAALAHTLSIKRGLMIALPPHQFRGAWIAMPAKVKQAVGVAPWSSLVPALSFRPVDSTGNTRGQQYMRLRYVLPYDPRAGITSVTNPTGALAVAVRSAPNVVSTVKSAASAVAGALSPVVKPVLWVTGLLVAAVVVSNVAPLFKKAG